jgi:hypothetical protein
VDNNTQFQLRESGATINSTPIPTVDPIDTSTTTVGDSSTTTNTGADTGDNGGGATVTTPTDINNSPAATETPIIKPIPEKPETGYEKAEKYANLSIRWAIVLVMLGLTYNLVKQYRAPKPTAPIA